MKLPRGYKEFGLVEDSRLVLQPTGAPVDVGSIKRGIIFVLAKWSGASQLAFRGLNEALASIPDLGDMRLYVIDADDEVTRQLVSSLGDVSHGCGETYWIRDGKVVGKLLRYATDSLPIITEHTKQVLA